MRLLSQIAASIFWFALWMGIPGALLYPVALWMLKHTQFSADFVGQGYVIAVAALFFPSAFLVDFLYRRFILKRRISSSDPLRSR